MYLPTRFYVVLCWVALGFVPAYVYPGWFSVAVVLGLVFLLLLGFNFWKLMDGNNRFRVFREFPEIVSIGEENEVKISIQNDTRREYRVQVFPELPEDYYGRQSAEIGLRGMEEKEEFFTYRPLKRGKKSFGRIRIFISLFPYLLLKRMEFGKEEEVKVYPSVVQMRKYSLRIAGMKMMERRLVGAGMDEEFEEIKNYVRGDDRRRINWRASGKSGQLMVNRYKSEQSRDLYCVLDISRPMLREENGICILEQGINAALVLSHVVMDKNDRIGLILVGKKACYQLAPDSGIRHLKRFLEELYDINGEADEADYGDLARLLRLKIRRRSTFLWIAHEEQREEWKVDRRHVCLPVMMRTGETSKIIPEVLTAYFNLSAR